MKLSELITEMESVLKEEGDLEVWCECDHGQWPENVYQASVSYFIEDGSQSHCIHEDDVEEYRDNYGDQVQKVFFIN
jgi:hypothetical protein